MILHGFLGSHEDFLPMTQRFDQHYHFVLLDLPGHGKSVNLQRYVFEEVFETLSKIKAQYGIFEHLMGYSLGGRTALYASLEDQTLTKSLVLVSASPGLKSEEARRKRIEADKRWIQKLRECSDSELIDLWYGQAVFSLSHLKRDALLDRIRKTKRDELIKSLQHMGTGAMPSLWNKLNQLSMPVILITGQFDTKFEKLAQKIKQLSTNTRVDHHSLPGDHIPHLHSEDEFCKIIFNRR